MLPDLVLKDYWVTRVLHVIGTDSILNGKTLFKGGTSLSKGWGLINRFSEDVDLLLTGPDFGEPPEPEARRKLLKHLHTIILSRAGLQFPTLGSVDEALRRFLYSRDSWHSRVRYLLPGVAATVSSPSADWVLVEAGFRGGPNPHARCLLQSLVGDYLSSRGLDSQLPDYREDLSPFEMDLLRPERTFAEKLVYLHVTMSKGVEGASEIRIRHYADVVELARCEAVERCIADGSIKDLVRDAALITNRYFNGSIDIENLDLRESPALAPSDAELPVLRERYENPLEAILYYRGRLPFDELIAQLAALRERYPGV